MTQCYAKQFILLWMISCPVMDKLCHQDCLSIFLSLSFSEVASLDRTAVLLQRRRVCAAVVMPPVTAYGRIHDVIKAIEEKEKKMIFLVFLLQPLLWGKRKRNASVGHGVFVVATEFSDSNLL